MKNFGSVCRLSSGPASERAPLHMRGLVPFLVLILCRCFHVTFGVQLEVTRANLHLSSPWALKFTSGPLVGRLFSISHPNGSALCPNGSKRTVRWTLNKHFFLPGLRGDAATGRLSGWCRRLDELFSDRLDEQGCDK